MHAWGSQVDITCIPYNNFYRCMVTIVTVKIFENLAIATNIHLAVKFTMKHGVTGTFPKGSFLC